MKDRYINDLLARQAYISENMQKKDPFDKAIMKAISSAKESIGMDSDQEDRALRNSLLSFGEEMSKMPKRKGFMANFAQVGRALTPALRTHDAYEQEAQEENKKMLEYAQNLRAAEEAKIAQLEANAYQREMADKQLAHQQAMLNEQKRYHDKSLLAKLTGKQAKVGHKKTESPEELEKVLNHAENRIKQLGSEGKRGIIKRMINKSWIPTGGDLPLTPEQAEIQTIGDVLKGKLFNAWGYRNQAEFEHVPSVSPDNDMATNLNIINNLKKMLLDVENQDGLKNNLSHETVDFSTLENNDNTSLPDFVTMFDMQGNEYQIPSNEVNEALNDGLRK